MTDSPLTDKPQPTISHTCAVELFNALLAMTNYAQAALDQFKNGRGSLDITAFNNLIPIAHDAIARAEKEMQP